MRPRMSQTWGNLLFLHFAVDPDELRPLIPDHLTIETYCGKAWVGVVLFEMRNVRLAGSPLILSAPPFPEFNVRTYVNRDGRDSGVWFFSLDAADRRAVAVAQRFFHLPYYFASMALHRKGNQLEFHESRHVGRAMVEGTCRVGATIGPAVPSTLEHFLVERYVFHTVDAVGRRYLGRVHHEPYQLRHVEEHQISQSLTDATAIPGQPFSHATFCDGVDVNADWLRLTT